VEVDVSAVLGTAVRAEGIGVDSGPDVGLDIFPPSAMLGTADSTEGLGVGTDVGGGVGATFLRVTTGTGDGSTEVATVGS